MIDIRITRTVPQIPARRAARFAPLERVRVRKPVPPADDMFHVAHQILVAQTDRERAAILLRLPDDIVVTRGHLLREACTARSFPMGATFLEHRLAALTATRDRDGKLPEHHVRSLEIWRRGFVALANGVKA